MNMPRGQMSPATPTIKHHLLTSARIWTALILFRCINALCSRTFFQPDEYFQSLEPAWQMAFGPQSGAWITWEWQHQLRSSIHPAMFAALYFVADKLMLVLGLVPSSRAAVLESLPTIVQAVIAATGDFYTWKLAEKIHGSKSDLLLTVCSPWQWFVSTRTFSNSVETTLTIAALYFWPWQMTVNYSRSSPNSSAQESSKSSIFQAPSSLRHLRISLLLAITACILRPTNGMIWLCMLTPSLHNIISSTPRIPFTDNLIFFREGILCGLIVLAVSGLSDRLYFGFWTFPPYQWLTFNITLDLAVFYGRNDWHYYLSQGIPLLTTTFLPFTLLGMWSVSSGIPFMLLVIVLQMIGALSLIVHKEVRFIYPLLPLLHIITGPVIASYFLTSSTTTTATQSPTPSKAPPILRCKPALLALLITNTLLSTYLTQRHQSGVLAATTQIRHLFESHPATSSSAPTPFAAFLMPCHSTPWRSSLIHPNLHAWALTCEPPISIPIADRDSYRSENDLFYDDPVAFWEKEIGGEGREWPPRFVVGFEGLESLMDVVRREINEGKGVGKWREVWRAFNSDWIDDGRRWGDVVIWEVLET
ncbi:family 22 glycosyltransferase [Calycina marina]|uniref:Mannosyltransferase n=1 Tax=Calycina marina TaxID=1763456 RepID=A0A9P7Z6G2_9HELO|nr:family 22 glycosyltransferase [Calycina marina]